MTERKKRIVVLGGSFNPPSLAHYRLMKEAVDVLGADIGFFVPVSDAYLKRKMRKSHPPVVLSPELRVKMLQAMCCEDKRLQVCDKEIGTIEPRTVPTMQALHKDYPDAELYSVMGADKLKLLSLLTEKRGFLDICRVILFSREDDRLEQTLKRHKVLSNYLNRIVMLPQPEGTDTISSSMIRERMLSGEKCQDLLHPGVWDLFKDFTPDDFPDAINSFKGRYAFLDNCFSCHFTWQGLEYSCAEAAFQSSKCEDKSERLVYADCSADKATSLGKDQVPYSGWEDARLDIMESILKAKFSQNPDLMEKLIDTGNRILINGNKTNNTFWGVNLYSWKGENHLGRIIMNIRDKEILK